MIRLSCVMQGNFFVIKNRTYIRKWNYYEKPGDK